uniref:CCHC-type domain-containing protein n=1 Tax=Trichogramma kaykai TaxID=54128 RepID=A0ABD2WBF8_9HYME
MKNSLLQIEASKTKRNQEKAPRVNAASVPPIEEIVCYRCTKVGHYASSCPLVPQNLWFCYICNEVKRHNSKSCPNKCQEYVSNNSNSNNKNNNKSKIIRGVGRGRGRSSFGVKRFTPYSKRPKAQRTDIEYIQASENSQVSELGREDLDHTESDISIERKIIDLNIEISDEEIENLSWNFPKPLKRDPDSEGMLWHRRLGHTSR